eukprot:21001_1
MDCVIVDIHLILIITANNNPSLSEYIPLTTINIALLWYYFIYTYIIIILMINNKTTYTINLIIISTTNNTFKIPLSHNPFICLMNKLILIFSEIYNPYWHMFTINSRMYCTNYVR